MLLCDWRVPSGVWCWWLCDVKMVKRWCWRMREIECTTIAHCNISWRYSYDIPWWNFMYYVRCENSLWDLMYFGHCRTKHGYSKKNLGFVVGCVLFSPNPHGASCFMLHILRMRFSTGIFLRFMRLLWGFFMRLHAFWCVIFVWERVHAF